MTDVRTLGASPAGLISCADVVNAGIAGGGEFIFQNGVFLFDKSIKLPSNTTIYIKNAKLKMADESYDNFFRNADFVNGNTNINIVGLGCAVLDGNAANNDDDYALYPLNGAGVYHYVGIVFCGVSNFTIKNIKYADSAHYHMIIQKSTQGIIDNIFLNQYTTTVNQDGIGLRFGSNNITLSNIRGRTKDDFFSIHIGKGNSDLLVNEIDNWNIGDVHDIEFKDINIYDSVIGALYAGIVGDGNKAYNISFEDCLIITGGCIFYNSYGASFYNTPPAKSDWTGITFDNITINALNARDAVFMITENMGTLNGTDIVNNTEEDMCVITAGDQDSVLINEIEYVV